MTGQRNLLMLFMLMSALSVRSQSCSNIYYPRYNDTFTYVYSCSLEGAGEDYFTTSIRPKCIAVDWDSSPHKLYIGLVPSSGNGKIIKCDLDGSNQTDVITEIVGINDIELDLSDRKIYWAKNTYSSDGIFKADMDGENSGIEQIYSASVNGRDLWGLALDASSGMIWFTERGSNCYASYVSSITTAGESLSDIKNPICNPHDIEYYNGNLYLGTNDGLERLATDGSEITTLLADADVAGLAIDATNEKIYWADYISNSIKCADLDGSNETEITASHSVLTSVDTDFNIAALPVELISFSGEIENNSICLRWQTATETNNYGFEIERASSPPDGQAGEIPPLDGGDEHEWEFLSFVPGHGNSNSPKSYEYSDAAPQAGENVYRLKQIDTDGTHQYYNTTAVVNYSVTGVMNMDKSPTEFNLSQNYPNPFNAATVIYYRIPNEDRVNYKSNGMVGVELKVFDVLGKELATLVREDQCSGYYEACFNGERLSSGIYYYVLTINEKMIAAKKMILSK